MKLKDLYDAIAQLNQEHYNYPLNNHSQVETHILEYNKKTKAWEFYFSERGGKYDFKTFATEKEACNYVLNAAIKCIKTIRDADMDATKRKYLGEVSDLQNKIVYNSSSQLMNLYDMFYAIEQLGRHKDDYLKDRSIMNIFNLHCSYGSKDWKYGYFHEVNGVGVSKIFATKEEACEYMLNTAIESIKTFKDLYMDSIKREYLSEFSE